MTQAEYLEFKKDKKAVKNWLISSLLAVFGVCITFYVNTNIAIGNLNNSVEENKSSTTKLEEKVDRIIEASAPVKVERLEKDVAELKSLMRDAWLQMEESKKNQDEKLDRIMNALIEIKKR